MPGAVAVPKLNVQETGHQPCSRDQANFSSASSRSAVKRPCGCWPRMLGQQHNSQMGLHDRTFSTWLAVSAAPERLTT